MSPITDDGLQLFRDGVVHLPFETLIVRGIDSRLQRSENESNDRHVGLLRLSKNKAAVPRSGEMTGDEPARGNFPEWHRLCTHRLGQRAPTAQPASDDAVDRTRYFARQREGIASRIRIRHWHRSQQGAGIGM